MSKKGCLRVRVSEELRKRAERLARRNGLSLAELVRCGIRTQLAHIHREDNQS